MTDVELGLFHSEADAVCHRCGNMYEIAAYAAFVDGDWTCPDCAGFYSPGIDDIIRGLDLVFNGITCDMFTRMVLVKDLDTVTHALRRLAELVDDIRANRTQLRISVKAVEGAFEEEGHLIGVSIDREIVTPRDKEIAK
ncbi:hypothetical protein AB0L53_54625 [Nonomuraea sp. NPDC052129]|uniref:hypothetical protein n=1 Tax=Nonomuraea sp. NPDC052129 TaxID=3154651 RepID=UPI00342A260E